MNDALAVVIFFLPIVDWIVAAILLDAGHQAHITALTERGVVALVLAVAATMAAVLAWIRLTKTHIDADLAVGILLIVLLGLSVPALNFLRVYGRDGFTRRGK